MEATEKVDVPAKTQDHFFSGESSDFFWMSTRDGKRFDGATFKEWLEALEKKRNSPEEILKQKSIEMIFSLKSLCSEFVNRWDQKWIKKIYLAKRGVPPSFYIYILPKDGYEISCGEMRMVSFFGFLIGHLFNERIEARLISIPLPSEKDFVEVFEECQVQENTVK